MGSNSLPQRFFSRDSHEFFDSDEFRSYGPPRCPGDLVLRFDGECIEPKISQKITVFKAPPTVRPKTRLPKIPDPEVDYNVVFVRTPEQSEPPEPIVIPPPEQRNVVYVLTKTKEDSYKRKVVKLPPGEPNPPDVYYVNYKDGETPELPGGIDIKSVISEFDTLPTEEAGEEIDTPAEEVDVEEAPAEPAETYSENEVRRKRNQAEKEYNPHQPRKPVIEIMKYDEGNFQTTLEDYFRLR